VDDLIVFLNARLDEGEATARPLLDLNWRAGEGAIGLSIAASMHVVRHDPARELREVEADRAIIARYEFELSHGKDASGPVCWAFYEAIKLRAAVHSDHPAYKAEWKP
jgi:hypothetical protein